jgi:hypothetical protein
MKSHKQSLINKKELESTQQNADRIHAKKPLRIDKFDVRQDAVRKSVAVKCHAQLFGPIPNEQTHWWIS